MGTTKREAAVERFLRYVAINTASVLPKAGEEPNRPSSPGQLELGALIKKEIAEITPTDILEIEDGSFLMTLRPSSDAFKDAPHVCLAAHMDTSYEASGDVNPQRITYKDGDVILNDDVSISASDLVGLKGREIITPDGTSLLGADDKAGLTGMMEVLSRIYSDDLEHGPLTLWFCVDEEIGALDISLLPKEVVESWDVLLTLDGERVSDVDIGCFICSKTDIVFTGESAHPGVSPDKLKPAHYAAAMLVGWIAMDKPNPMETSGNEPFYYMANFEASAANATVTAMPRSFDREEHDAMTDEIIEMAKTAAEKFGVQVDWETKIICINTRETIEGSMHLIDPIVAALQAAGYEGKLANVRGGTDGAMAIVTYPDLVTPNIGTGCTNLHGIREFLVVDELMDMIDVVVDVLGRFSKMKKAA